MPSQRAIQALLDLQREKLQNSEQPFALASAYNLNEPNESQRFQIQRQQPEQTDKDSNVSLLQAVGAGLYEFGESASFGAVGFAEIGAERALGREIEFQEYFRQAQEESSLAKVLGGVGTGAGYLLGAPMKLTARVLQKPATSIVSKLVGKQTIGKASKEFSEEALKAGIEKGVVNKYTNVLKGKTAWASTKGKDANKKFAEQFNNEINKRTARASARKELTDKQIEVVQNMKDRIINNGIPLQNLSQYARTTYGNSKFGRFATEALHDAFVFSVADAVMDVSFQGQQLVKDENAKFNLGQTGYAVATGFLAGTAINAATAPFGPLGKMFQSRKDFASGLRAYLGTNTYKGKDLEYLSGNMAEIANMNRKNNINTSYTFTSDGKQKSIDLLQDYNNSKTVNSQEIAKQLRKEFGDNAEKKAQQWLMSQKRFYGKEIIKEATREGLENYRLLFPRMMVAGAAMSGVQGIQMYVQGQDLQAEDFISSMLIGAWTQRRGNFARSADLNGEINNLRKTLDHLGIDNSQTFFASTFSKPNNVFGVGLSRDNETLKNYLIEQRIVSDTDETITSDKLPEGEKTFLDLESGRPFDPYDGKLNKLYQIMSEDYNHVKSLDQISERQARRINEIIETQGFKTTEDIDKAFTQRVEDATQNMEENLVNVLNRLRSADLDGFSVDANNNKLVIPNSFEIDSKLLKKAKDGEFESWLGKSGEQAAEELLNAKRSFHTVEKILIGIDRAEPNNTKDNKILTEDALKDFYNIIRDSEKSINRMTNPKDGRREFRYTDSDSYIIPLIQNKGKLFTQRISDVLSKDTMPQNLQSYLINSGLLKKTKDGEVMLIDDISRIETDYENKANDLGRLHGILMALGDYKITSEKPNEPKTTQIEALKFILQDNKIDIDTFNKPSMKFLYQMTLNDINRRRMNNKVTNSNDINFLLKQSGSAMYSDTGLLSEGGVSGFSLYRVNIPHTVRGRNSDNTLEYEYNKILERLNEETDGLVKISERKVVTINETQGNQLKLRMLEIYDADTKMDNQVLHELFDTMSNSRLDSVKTRMLEYMKTLGDPARIDILTMLRRQGIIKRNVDNNLEINEKFTLEKITEEADVIKRRQELKDALEPINKKLMKRGYTEEFIQKEIADRQKIDRRYFKEARDEVKNPSIGIDEFYRKYQFKIIKGEVDGIPNVVEIKSYADESNADKVNRFLSKEYMLGDDGNLNKESITKLQNDLVYRGESFKDLSPRKKQTAIQDVTQIVFGLKDRMDLPTMSIRNGTIIYDPVKEREFFQKNPVFNYLNDLNIDYAIFNNNVTYTEFNDYIVDRTYNILSTESLGDKEKANIDRIRSRVAEQLKDKSLGLDLSTQLNEKQLADGEYGIVKLDIYDGMDSIVINRSAMKNIVDDFSRFYNQYKDKLTGNSKKSIEMLNETFKETKNIHRYDEASIELATRYLILETSLKSETDHELLKVLNSNDAQEIGKYIKRIKLVTTKNFIRPNEEYLKSIIQSRTALGDDKASKLIKKRLKIESHRVAIWDDGTENMATLINEDLVNEFGDQIPALKNYSLKNIIGNAHEKVSGFDSISFISKDAMMEYHTYMGHSSESKNPIKPIISSQGEGKTLLYGKTLFVYSPSLDGFFKRNNVDILLTGSGAKIYDPKIVGGKEQDSVIKDVRWDELVDSYTITKPDNLIRDVDIDAIGFRPEKDADLLSASESDADYNYMNRKEHEDAFKGLLDELTANLNSMDKILKDPYKMNAFMKEQLMNNNIPSSPEQGALGNLSNMMYYLQLSDAANPYDYSSNQVQKYLAQQYIDTLFSTRRSITNRVYSDKDKKLALPSNRYGGQAPLIQSAKGYLGKGLKTRLFPTLFNDNNEMILRGQIVLPFAERNTSLSELPDDKNVRIVQNERILSLEEFKNEIKDTVKDIDEIPNLTTLRDGDNKTIESIDDILNNATVGSVHDFLESYSKLVNRRYELGIVSRRNPRTRPNDITMLGLKGFLDKEQGLGVEINSFDIVNTYEGDYDADKVDYFFAHSDYMFDYIKRNQAYYVQGIDPEQLQQKPTFTFQMNADDSRVATLSKMGQSIAFKKAIGIAQKTPRKLNYLQNLANVNHLSGKTVSPEWEDVARGEEGNFVGPGILYNSKVNAEGKATEVVTIDTESLAFYQRAALEVQYIIDGANNLNKNIAGNIYEWAEGFLFPKYENSISPTDAKSEDLKSILRNGRTENGKRVRIFSKYELVDGKYREVREDLNSADKLIINEFLNQQNKLLNVFGDTKYVAGEKRKTSFYDLNMGSMAFRNFHKDIYQGMQRQLFYKKKGIQDKKYLKEILDPENERFKPISSTVRNVYDGESGNYLDRIAIQIAQKEILEDRKQYNLDIETYQDVENWYQAMISSPSRFEESSRLLNVFEQEKPTGATIEEQREFVSQVDQRAKGIKDDTQAFNRQIAIIKKLDNKKKSIARTNYSWKWKKKKTDNINWVIKKLRADVKTKFGKNIDKIHSKDLTYKNYISVEDSNLKSSIIHANTMNAMLRNFFGTKYDNWFETLNDDARKDLKSIKDFNRQTYGSNTLLDEIFPYGKKSLITNENIIKYVEDYRGDMGSVYELRQNYLTRMIEKHGVNFLYAYMEPTRNRDDIGIFNNRPIAIPYKESARYRHGLQTIVGIANGTLKLGEDSTSQERARNWGEWILNSTIQSNEHYRRFFDKDIAMMNLTDSNMERFGLMPFDRGTENRLREDGSDFQWLSEMLPSNPLSTINKSVTQFYSSYAKMIPDKTKDDYKEFLKGMNDLEEFSSRKDYINPMKYLKLKLEMDESFLEILKKDIFTMGNEQGIPTHLKNNPMYTHLKYLKFNPKQVKSTDKLVGMLRGVNQVHEDLMTGARQNPMRDSGYEAFRMMKDYAKCK